MNKHKSLIKHLDFIIADVVISQLSYLLGCYIWAWVNHSSRPVFSTQYWHEATMLLLCEAVSLLIGNPYKNVLKRNKYQEVAASAKHTLTLLVLYIFLIYFSHEGGIVSRLTVVFTWITYFVADTAFRLMWKRLLRHHFLKGRSESGNAMILITDRGQAPALIRNLKENIYSPYFIKGIFLTDYGTAAAASDAETTDSSDDSHIHRNITSSTSIGDIPVLGNVTDAVGYAANHWVDEVMICLNGDSANGRDIEPHFEKMGITTHRVLLELPEEWQSGTTSVDRYGNLIVTTHVLRNIPLWRWGAKRFIDILGSLVGLALTGIIFIFVAPRIYHADKGPVIYSSIRIGRNGRPFKFYKFRSMYLDADKRKEELMQQNKMQGLMFKIDNDPRILPGIGQFIRRTSLDEFPQFWNVLKGDMSLVGTRPPTQDEWEQYGEEHRIRMTQRPGITGIWQVSGRSSITDFNEVVKMDERYIETWTLGMDFTIILKTIGKVFKKEGAE